MLRRGWRDNADFYDGVVMMRIIARLPGYAIAFLLAGTAALAAPAAAQASAALPGPAVVPCSSSALAAAIQNANSAPMAVLRLSPGCNYVLTTAASAAAGLPTITGKIIVIGGHGTEISRSPAAAPFRILNVAPGGALTLAGVTVANGKLTADAANGAGILDAGSLVLRSVRLTGNTSAAGSGGGLSVGTGAQATISGSELDGNNAVLAQGGAIVSRGDLVIDRSALTGNTAFAGGAVFAAGSATTRISHTTVSRNSAKAVGGGIFNQGALALTADRVTFNAAAQAGGGIVNSGAGTVTLRFTVVAFNTPDNCSPHGTIPGCQG